MLSLLFHVLVFFLALVAELRVKVPQLLGAGGCEVAFLVLTLMQVRPVAVCRMLLLSLSRIASYEAVL